jgi:hypothetical protein
MTMSGHSASTLKECRLRASGAAAAGRMPATDTRTAHTRALVCQHPHTLDSYARTCSHMHRRATTTTQRHTSTLDDRTIAR